MRRWLWLLLQLQVLEQIHIVVTQTDLSPANKTIRVGYLWQYDHIAGALNVGIDHAQNDGLLPGYNFRYSF